MICGKESVTQEKKRVVVLRLVSQSNRGAGGKVQMDTLFNATQRFDREAILRSHYAHRDFERETNGQYVQVGALEYLYASLIPADRMSAEPNSVPLVRLNPISITQLQVGTVHRGRVLYGTLCADAFVMGGIMTVLDDDNGLAVRLAIYNTDDRTVKGGPYPKGAKVAIRDPYFKLVSDGGLTVRVDRPAYIHILNDH